MMGVVNERHNYSTFIV